MNKNELVEIIREVVKSELKNIGPSLVREALLESLGANIAPINESKNEPEKLPVQRKASPPQPKKEVKYSSNPVLNQILNETRGGIPQEKDTMVMASFEENIPEEVLENNTELAGVLKATKKDYRAFLKAMDKKRP